MSEWVPEALRELVRQRARGRCEYCLVHAEDAIFGHTIDHVIARKHGGETHSANLAWACVVCNAYKGSDLASINVETGRLVRLYNPRKDRWSSHFRLRGGRIIPRTANGRVTVFLLQLNLPEQIGIRQSLIRQRRYPR